MKDVWLAKLDIQRDQNKTISTFYLYIAVKKKLQIKEYRKHTATINLYYAYHTVYQYTTMTCQTRKNYTSQIEMLILSFCVVKLFVYIVLFLHV